MEQGGERCAFMIRGQLSVSCLFFCQSHVSSISCEFNHIVISLLANAYHSHSIHSIATVSPCILARVCLRVHSILTLHVTILLGVPETASNFCQSVHSSLLSGLAIPVMLIFTCILYRKTGFCGKARHFGFITVLFPCYICCTLAGDAARDETVVRTRVTIRTVNV